VSLPIVAAGGAKDGNSMNAARGATLLCGLRPVARFPQRARHAQNVL
jgi:hypothetical protein